MTRRALLFAAPSMLIGQQADITGWSKARWGMTSLQLKAAFGEAFSEKKHPETGAVYGSMETTIDGQKFSAAFNFSGAALTSISLVWVIPDTEKTVRWLRIRAEDLERGLVEKYGPPELRQADIERESLKILWSRPSGTVTLGAQTFAGLPVLLVLTYRQRERKSDL